MGSEGGRETLKRYGPKHFSELGKKGIRSLADRYFSGSIGDAMEYLRKKGWEKNTARLVEEKLQKEIANGAAIAVEEIPVVLDVDEDPFYHELCSWADRVLAPKANGRAR